MKRNKPLSMMVIAILSLTLFTQAALASSQLDEPEPDCNPRAAALAEWMGEVPDARTCYLGGLVVTDQHGLTRAGGVPHKLLSRHSEVSGDVARAMAEGCRERFGSDYGLAVTRFPMFDPSAPEPDPVFLALAGPNGVDIKPVPYAGHPATLKIHCAKHALNMVRLALLESSTISQP